MRIERLLSPNEVENLYNIPTTTLEQWRSKKKVRLTTNWENTYGTRLRRLKSGSNPAES